MHEIMETRRVQRTGSGEKDQECANVMDVMCEWSWASLTVVRFWSTTLCAFSQCGCHMYMLPKTAAVAAKKSENRGEIAACSLANCRSPFPSFPPSRVPIALLPPPSQIASMRGYFPSHVPRFILGWSAPRTGLADVSCGEL